MSGNGELAGRMRALKRPATGVVFERAAELVRAGIDVISFAVGEPDFETPESIREAAKRAIDGGASRYTEARGVLPLREAICADSRRRRGGIEHGPDQVVVSVGAKHTLFNISQALYDPGDEVIIPIPSWVSYPEQARLAGARPVLVSCSEQDDFLLTAEALRRAVSERTRALVLCSPGNPTGAVYTEGQLAALAEVAREHSFWIVSDEVYCQLTYDGFRQRSILEVAPDLRDRIAVVDGVSKSHAMTGWRIGWLLGSERLAAACAIIQSQVVSNPTAVAQHAALAALSGEQASVEQMRAVFEQRRERMVSGLNAIAPLSCRMPRGAFYAFVDARGLLGKRTQGGTLHDDAQIAGWLLEEARVAVVPGSAFGAPGYLRFSFAVSVDRIEAGLGRVADAIARLG